MLNATHLRQSVIRPVLERLDMHSPAAEDLMLGTALAESGLRHLRQIRGPALGLWQMEPATHDDIWAHWLRPRPHRTETVLEFGCTAAPLPLAETLVGNLYYACAMARVHYWRTPYAIPDRLEDQAAYWKAHYNTALGAGTPEHYLRAWREVAGA